MGDTGDSNLPDSDLNLVIHYYPPAIISLFCSYYSISGVMFNDVSHFLKQLKCKLVQTKQQNDFF